MTYNVIYNRKVENCIRSSYKHQIQHSKQRGHTPPSYSYKELLEFALSTPKYMELYNYWVSTNYNRRDKPSFDRLDDNKSYSLDNIQVISFRDNEKKYNVQVREGRHNNGLLNGGHKAVCQLDIDGNIINEFISIMEASRNTPAIDSKIVCVCKGSRKTAGGFKWKYKI
jgi:hypothetical protein